MAPHSEVAHEGGGHSELDYPTLMTMWHSDTKILMASLIFMIFIGIGLRKFLNYLVHVRQNREKVENVVKIMALDMQNLTRTLSSGAEKKDDKRQSLGQLMEMQSDKEVSKDEREFCFPRSASCKYEILIIEAREAHLKRHVCNHTARELGFESGYFQYPRSVAREADLEPVVMGVYRDKSTEAEDANLTNALAAVSLHEQKKRAKRAKAEKRLVDRQFSRMETYLFNERFFQEEE